MQPIFGTMQQQISVLLVGSLQLKYMDLVVFLCVYEVSFFTVGPDLNWKFWWCFPTDNLNTLDQLFSLLLGKCFG